jgi:redox-sensitive bicupin YhaK (pirin superfamily)
MIHIRKSEDRGHFDHGWLDTYHTFSFADYYDPEHMSFRALRVINEDRVEPQTGFGRHPHREMEIITYVLDGELTHHDSMGNGSVIRPGEVQRMTAGSGIEHSEENNSPTDEVHLLQIWIRPNEKGLTPEYEQKSIPEKAEKNKLYMIASPVGGNGSLKIHQDVKLYSAIIGAGEKIEFELEKDRHAWVQVARGTVDLNGNQLKQGDGAGVSKETDLTISAEENSEILLFDLA